jgi:hypothetical protein
LFCPRQDFIVDALFAVQPRGNVLPARGAGDVADHLLGNLAQALLDALQDLAGGGLVERREHGLLGRAGGRSHALQRGTTHAEGRGLARLRLKLRQFGLQAGDVLAEFHALGAVGLKLLGLRAQVRQELLDVAALYRCLGRESAGRLFTDELAEIFGLRCD